MDIQRKHLQITSEETPAGAIEITALLETKSKIILDRGEVAKGNFHVISQAEEYLLNSLRLHFYGDLKTLAGKANLENKVSRNYSEDSAISNLIDMVFGKFTKDEQPLKLED